MPHHRRGTAAARRHSQRQRNASPGIARGRIASSSQDHVSDERDAAVDAMMRARWRDRGRVAVLSAKRNRSVTRAAGGCRHGIGYMRDQAG